MENSEENMHVDIGAQRVYYLRTFCLCFIYPQQSTAGSRGGQWGWDDDDDEDMSAFDVPDVEYKVSDQCLFSSYSIKRL